ncbi:TRM44 (YPL030W) [Zygosaccharomyces parabailii]|nr:TRM44 (YPL030W) [Zygosaccharomyces parabailii]CDH08809.1 probable tRNA (uracil-O(2)-)-methyltransferase [Zygosaccharomyces bailii ISA1307]
MSPKRDEFKFESANESILGKDWFPIYSTREDVKFGKNHFEIAMMNVIKEPNINSSAILRADILQEVTSDPNANRIVKKCEVKDSELADPEAKKLGVDDFKARYPSINPTLKLYAATEIVRRIIPRNPYKDAIMNQTCLILNSAEQDSTSLVIYVPHIQEEDDCPFYIPHVKAVGIFLHQGSLSVHYIPFKHAELFQDESDRVVRTAWRLLQTAHKHSMGVMQGYQKRVRHDLVVDKVDFQNRYIALKKKYSKLLVDNWKESTDPKKHVFEDIATAAFLIALWTKIYGADYKEKMQFRDLGCGNGVLCYILLTEGIKGIGIDARRRKSWSSFPAEVQACLKEQIIIPSVLVRPHPEVKKRLPQLEHNGGLFPVKVAHELIAPATVVYTSEDLLSSPQVNVTEFPPNTFIIGNHSDELTCWIPLLGYPFMVIPCCSHNFSGQRVRFNVRKSTTELNSAKGNSTYAGLVDHVLYIADRVGWKVEQEMLRIPSTRNAAVIGYENAQVGNFPTQEVYDLIMEDGGPNGWIQNSMALMKKSPRNH